MPTKRLSATLMVTAVLSAAVLAGCGASPDDSRASASAEPKETKATSVEIEDNNGKQTIAVPPKSVVALDNRTFETLSDWGVKLSAASVSLMPDTIAYTKDKSIVDVGNHREPNLEAIVAANPDLVINGQRFTQYQKDIAKLVPNAKIIDLDPRENKPFDEELKRQTTDLGNIFGKQTEAKKLNADLDKAIKRVKNSYKGQSVMSISTSGGEIGFIGPSVGRTLGPLYDVLNLKPALQVKGSSDNHKGDDISVEAIADSNPDWILVMDRDAAISADDPAYKSASDIIENSPALANVSAVKNGNVVYMPADTYTNEGIQTYIEFLNSFADALEGKKK